MVVTHCVIDMTSDLCSIILNIVPSGLQEELILGVVNDPDCHPKEFRHSYLRSTLVLVLVTLMVSPSQSLSAVLHHRRSSFHPGLYQCLAPVQSMLSSHCVCSFTSWF